MNIGTKVKIKNSNRTFFVAFFSHHDSNIVNVKPTNGNTHKWIEKDNITLVFI